MHPHEIIRDLADRADDLLAGASNRAQARAGLEEQITMDYLGLPNAERAQVVDAVMLILENEGFFDVEPGGLDDDDAPPE